MPPVQLLEWPYCSMISLKSLPWCSVAMVLLVCTLPGAARPNLHAHLPPTAVPYVHRFKYLGNTKMSMLLCQLWLFLLLNFIIG
jgi:hypothetical protein